MTNLHLHLHRPYFPSASGICPRGCSGVWLPAWWPCSSPAKVGVTWHLRWVMWCWALLLFRGVGVVGGRWSRFASFFGPGRVRYLRGQGEAQARDWHNRWALSVFVPCCALLAQVLTGLMADDEIAFSGRSRFVSGDTVAWAASLHTDVGPGCWWRWWHCTWRTLPSTPTSSATAWCDHGAW